METWQSPINAMIWNLQPLSDVWDASGQNLLLFDALNLLNLTFNFFSMTSSVSGSRLPLRCGIERVWGLQRVRDVLELNLRAWRELKHTWFLAGMFNFFIQIIFQTKRIIILNQNIKTLQIKIQFQNIINNVSFFF